MASNKNKRLSTVEQVAAAKAKGRLSYQVSKSRKKDEEQQAQDKAISGQLNSKRAYYQSAMLDTGLNNLYNRDAAKKYDYLVGSGLVDRTKYLSAFAQYQLDAGKNYMGKDTYDGFSGMASAASDVSTEHTKNVFRARSGDASVLTEQQAEIDKLKKAGLDNNWFRDLINRDKYTNKDEIDAAEKQYEEYVRLLQLSGMEDLAAAKPKTSMIDYTRDALKSDLMTMVYKAQGIDVGTDEYQAAAKRVRDFTGSTQAESDAFADTSGKWVDKYLGMYDQRMNTLDKYIAKNSTTYGTEYAFGADDYVQYMRELSAYEKQTAEIEQKQAEADQKVQDKWGNLEKNPDFATYSQHKPHEGSYYNEYDELNWQAQVNDMVALGADPKKFEDAANILSLDPTIDTEAYGYLEYGLQHMTNQDRTRFFYLYNSPEYGPDAALEYLDDISYRTMRQNTVDYQKAIATGVDGSFANSAAATIAAPVYGLMNSVAALNTMAEEARGKNIHEYDPNFLYGVFQNTITGEVGGNIAEATPWAPKWFGQNIFQMGYNAVTSAASSALSMAAFGPAGSVALGFGAFNSSYQQGLAAGKSDKDAFIDALVDGGIEVGTEAMSIDALMGDSYNPLGYFLKNVFTEGFEEGIGTTARMGYDQLKYGIESQINRRITELTVMGYDPTDATKLAWKEWLNTLGQDFTTGAISGATMAGPVAVQSQVQNYNTGNEARENMEPEDWDAFIELAGSTDLSKSGQRIYNDLKNELAQQKNAQAQANAEQQKDTAQEEDLNPEEEHEEQQAEENAQAKAEAEQQKNAEIAEDLDSESAQDELTAEKNAQAQENVEQEAAQEEDLNPEEEHEEQQAEKNAQAAKNAQAQENAETAKDLSTESAKNELTTGKNAQAQQNAGKKNKPVSKAKIGQLYRETMQKLDAQAQDSLREYMSFNVAKELKGLGVPGKDAKDLAGSILRIQDGKFTDADVQAVDGSSAARTVLAAWTAKEKAAASAQGKVYDLAGLLVKKGDPSTSASKVTDDDEDELLGDDEFDAVVADVQEREGSTLVSEGETSTLDGEEIEILGVDTTGGTPKVKIRTAGGEERSVAADSIAYGESDASVYARAAFAAEYGEFADVAFDGIQPGQDVTEYARAFHKAAQYGSDGKNLDVLKNSGAVSVLSDAQIEAAYEIGRTMRAQRNQAQQQTRSAKGANVAVGNVDTTAIRGVKLTTHQRKSIAAMGKISKALGINVRFVKSRTDARGYYTDDNGAWNANTRTLTLSIDAGGVSKRDIRFAMMDTAGHELTHYIKQFADSELWDEYQDFIISHLDSKEGFDLEKEIKKLMAEDKSLDRDAALEEVIADASAKALSRISEQDLADLAESNPTLFGKIKKFLTKWAKSLKRAIDEAFGSTMGETNHIAKAMGDVLDEMAPMWNTLLANASQNAHESRSATEALRMSAETQQAIENDQAVDAEAELKHSIRRNAEFGEEARRINEKYGFVSADVLDKALEVREAIRDIFLKPENLNKLNLPPDIEGDTFVSDSSYGGTEENTTVCIRSMAAQALMDLVSQNLGRPLTVQDTLLISQEIAGLTDRPECYYCYVATDRRAYRDFLGQYLEQRNAVIEKYKAGADRAALYTEFLGGRKPTANMKARFNMWLNAVDKGIDMIDGNDLASLEHLFSEVDNLRSEILAAAAEASGIDASKLNIVKGSVKYAKAGKQMTATTLNALMKSNPSLADNIYRYMQLTDATAYAQSASWAKKMKGYAAYNGHILKWSPDRVSNLNKHYGLRMYSFSDFSPAFILENMQMVTDAAVRGLNMLGYTKEMPFAEIFAPSGMNINISTFAYEQGGEVKEDYKQGASWERAKALREKYPNVGIVMVATSDKILEWALQQDWVDVVIPYHLVRTGTDVAEYFGYKNYTGVSADGKGLSFAEKNKGKAKKERVTSVSPVEHRNDLISYVDALERYGLTPRFAQWLNGLDDYLAGNITPKQFREMNPNYMKLVNETRRSYAETDPVQPKFDKGAAKEAIDQMIREGGYYTPVGGSMEAEFEIAGAVADKIRSGEDVKRMARAGIYSYSQEEYNRFRWTTQNGILSLAEMKNAESKIASMEHGGKPNGRDTADGKFAMQIGKEIGIDNVIIVTDKKLGAQGISRVYRINSEHETFIEEVRDAIYEAESTVGKDAFEDVQNVYGKTILECFHKKDYPYIPQSGGTGSRSTGISGRTMAGAPGPLRNRSGRAGASGGNESVAKSLLREQYDSDGNRLTFAQKDFFMDSKARDDEGNLLVLYHGSKVGRIDTFKTTEGYRKGLYLATNPKVADQFARSINGPEPRISTVGTHDDIYDHAIYKVYANVVNPFIVDAQSRFYYEVPTPDEMVETGKYGSTVDIQEINAWAMKNGYDGVIVEYVQESYGILTNDVIVFNQNQVKYVDNETPTADPDIKSQKRDLSNASDRDLLANALESLTANADELDILRRYQKRVQNLDAKQQLLQETEERLYELKQGDAKANRDEIIKLTNNVKTISDQISRMDKELLKLEVMAPIKKLADRERENYKQKLKAQTDERMRQYKARLKMDTQDKIREVREREAEKRRKLREQGDTRLRKAVQAQREVGQRKVDRVKESHDKEKYRAKILADAKKLYGWVVSPTNKGHTPQFLREPLAAFLESIDFTSARQLKGGDPTQNDRKFTDALDKLRYAIGDINKQQGAIDGGAASFAGYIDLPSDYMTEFDTLVKGIKETIEKSGDYTETPFNRMTGQQLKDMSKIFRILNSSISKMNTLVANSRYESAKTASTDTIADMNAMKAKTETNKLLSSVNSMFNWKNTTPYYAFQRMGRGGKAIFEALQDGWDKMAQNSAQLIKFAEDTFTPKQAKAWSKDTQSIKLDSGESVRMTAAQAMSFYCLSKRDQAIGHLKGGGIRVSDIDAGKGKTIRQVDNYILSDADIARIIGTLTAEQKVVADKLQRFMNTVCTEQGNEISMKRFGYEMFTEDNYFPIETDANNRSSINDKQDGNSSMFRLLNMSAMKPLTPGANGAIIVRDIFDVFSNHASDIGKYNALALPILDFIKWYNFVERTDVLDANGNPTGQIKNSSTQKALERAYGSDAKSYLMSFIKDLNAEHDGGRNDTILSKMMGNAKAGSVNLNARVALLQITSLPRAAYAINPKYLAGGMAKMKSLNPVNAIKGTEAQEDIGILKWKSLGFYSTDVARNTRSLVRRDEGIMTKIRDLAMKPAEWGDNWTSNIIYEAAKLEMKDKHPNLAPGSKAYDAKLNQRVREIVYKTQVVDSTMTRSDFMRSKGQMTAFTAFMSEPTLTVNMLNESIQEAVMKRRSGASVRESLRSVGGLAVRSAATFAFTMLASSLVESLFDAIRDDDDYEEFEDKFHEALGVNIKDNANIFAMLPILKDIISIAQGYESNSMVMQVATQLMDTKEAIEAWQKGERPVYSVIYNALKACGSATGVGVQNATRDGVGLYNTFLADAWDTPKIQTYSDKKADAAEAYYAALQEGDAEKAEWILHRAAVNGYDAKDMSTKFTTLTKDDYLAGKIDEATATKYLTEHLGKNKDDAYWLIQEWEYTGEGNFSKYTKFKTAMANGNSSAAMSAYRELVEHGTKEDSIKNELSGMYKSGEATTLMNLQMRSDKLWTSNLKLKTDKQVHKDDFDDFIDAIINGKNIAAEIKKLKDKGYTTSQCMSAINGAFGKSSDTYRIMEKYNKREASILLDRILDAYEVLGLSRKEEIAWINENWTMPEDD